MTITDIDIYRVPIKMHTVQFLGWAIGGRGYKGLEF